MSCYHIHNGVLLFQLLLLILLLLWLEITVGTKIRKLYKFTNNQWRAYGPYKTQIQNVVTNFVCFWGWVSECLSLILVTYIIYSCRLLFRIPFPFSSRRFFLICTTQRAKLSHQSKFVKELLPLHKRTRRDPSRVSVVVPSPGHTIDRPSLGRDDHTTFHLPYSPRLPVFHCRRVRRY